MFGLGGEEIIFIVVLVLLVVGPERLPQYTQKVAQFAKSVKEYVSDTKERVGQELGPEFSDVDWQKLDPRQYDPRKIVKDALLEDTILDPKKGASSAAASGAVLATKGNGALSLGFDTYTPLPNGEAAPFDSEAT